MHLNLATEQGVVPFGILDFETGATVLLRIRVRVINWAYSHTVDAIALAKQKVFLFFEHLAYFRFKLIWIVAIVSSSKIFNLLPDELLSIYE